MQKTQANVEADGRTVEDAIADGLRRLGVTRDQVDIKVIDEGKKGFLGMGGRNARVFLSITKKKSARPGDSRPSSRPATPPVEADPREAAAHATEVTEKILSQMGFAATVSSRVRDGQVMLEIDCSESEGRLIGRKGETLQSLQHLVSRITSRQFRERSNLVIDVSGYRARQTDKLTSRAQEWADDVIHSGREYRTEPLVAADRRIIHRTLADVSGVETQAIGSGPRKRVSIRPAGTPPPEDASVEEDRGRDRAPRGRREGGRGRDRGPSRDRGRDRDRGGRGRDRDRDRDRVRSRDHAQDHERVRSRDRDQDREPVRSRDHDQDREREPVRSRDRDRDRDRGRERDHRREPGGAPAGNGQSTPHPEPESGANEPLDLVGPADKRSSDSTEEAPRIGARSRRRRPARNRL